MIVQSTKESALPVEAGAYLFPETSKRLQRRPATSQKVDAAITTSS
jgi:hypothetical protein